VRWVAAELILKTSDTSELPQFFAKLGQAEGVAITEPLSYGGRIAAMKAGPSSPPASQVVDKYLSASHPVQVRMTALGYYFEVGTKADLPKIEAFASDHAKVPACKESAKDCEWKCEVGPTDKRETKEIATLGDFVTYCVKPAMEGRAKK
jgi:hypothetical protein